MVLTLLLSFPIVFIGFGELAKLYENVPSETIGKIFKLEIDGTVRILRECIKQFLILQVSKECRDQFVKRLPVLLKILKF
jgi:hypothetical protein